MICAYSYLSLYLSLDSDYRACIRAAFLFRFLRVIRICVTARVEYTMDVLNISRDTAICVIKRLNGIGKK